MALTCIAFQNTTNFVYPPDFKSQCAVLFESTPDGIEAANNLSAIIPEHSEIHIKRFNHNDFVLSITSPQNNEVFRFHNLPPIDGKSLNNTISPRLTLWIGLFDKIDGQSKRIQQNPISTVPIHKIHLETI